MGKVYKFLILFSIALVVISFLSSCCGCGRAKSKNPYSLTSHSWMLLDIEGVALTQRADSSSFRLTFDGEKGELYGMGDCNRFFGQFEKGEGHKLVIKDGGATKMFCPNQNLEDKYLQIIGGIDSYSIDGDVLMLLQEGKVKLTFVALPLESSK